MAELSQHRAEQLKQFLHDYADDDGTIMPSYIYAEIITGTGLPTVRTLRKYIGGWKDVALWAGLKPATRHHEDINHYPRAYQRPWPRTHSTIGPCTPYPNGAYIALGITSPNRISRSQPNKCSCSDDL